jgi:hypothetical protein
MCATPARKRKSKSKSKADTDTDAARTDPAKQWLSFDHLSERVQLSPAARAKWEDQLAWETKQVMLLRRRLKAQDTDELLQLHPNKQLPLDEVIQIGDLLLDEFDPSLLNLTHTIDPHAITMDHVDRAPGVTQQQMASMHAMSQRFQPPPNLQVVTIENLSRMLQTPVPLEDCALEKNRVPVIEPRCFVPLLWFAQVVTELPYKLSAKNGYLDEVKVLASNTAASGHKLVWKKAIEMYSQMKQGIADYLASASELTRAAQQEDEAMKEVKEEEAEVEERPKKGKHN